MGKSTAVQYRSFAESELFVCRFHFVTSFSSLVRAQQSKLKTYQFEVAKINERSTVRPTDRPIQTNRIKFIAHVCDDLNST